METQSKKQCFIGQHEDEEVLYVSRRHWLPMVIHFLRNLLLTTVWIILIDTAIVGTMYLTKTEMTPQFYTFVIAFSLIMLLPTISTTWTIYYLTLTIITDNRLVKTTQKGVFYNYMREVKLRGIQDTSYTFETWIQSMFNYGIIVAHTASGEEGKFKVRYLPRPQAVHHYLNQISKILHDNDVSGVKHDIPKFSEKEVWKNHTSK